ncbi:MAG: hypothetical protein AMJ53_05495 [Gammaproteobacteria bacterium SG8_11]|nr:MAG: hypothetical protein AMJ53_05495 [Gammaproteobacteria bacterium SG8_11]
MDVLKEYYFYSDLFIKEDIDLFSAEPQTFVSPSADSYIVSHPLTKAALAELLMAYPNTSSFIELSQRAAASVTEYGDGKFAGETDSFFNELVNLYLSGAINVTTTQRQCATVPSEKPRFNGLTRAFCRHNKFSVASVHHDSITLNRLQRELIELTDGHRDIQQITTELSTAINSDESLQAEYTQMLETLRRNDTLSKAIHSGEVNPAFVQQAITNLAYLGLLDS